MFALRFFLLSSVFGFIASQNSRDQLVRPIKAPAGLKNQPNATIVFPSEDTNKNRRPTHNRLPIADTRICYENELLYPGDNEGDWTCDCKPGFLHYPQTGFCYEAHTQGPCKRDEVLVLASNARIPECVRNSCDHGLVRFDENCYPLHSDEGCKKFNAFIGRKVLLVPNPTTASLVCADEDFFYECVKNCCVGSKREFRNICESTTGISREPSRQTRSIRALSKRLNIAT